MGAVEPCPECGAKNAPDARRCRICGRLVNAAIPEVDPRERELPEHVRRAMEREMGLGSVPPQQQRTHVPGGVSIGDDLSHLPPPPGSAPPAPPIGSLPPPPPGAVPSAAPPQDAPATPGYPAPDAPALVEPTWDPSLDDEGDVDGIVIEARPRHEAIPVFEPEEVVDEVFDPDALFRDLGQEPLPPPPPDPDELVLPPRETGPDPLWSIGEGRAGHLSTAEIERLTRAALREERLKRRPGFLDKVLKLDADEKDPPARP